MKCILALVMFERGGETDQIRNALEIVHRECSNRCAHC
jgi:hypothetical protein